VSAERNIKDVPVRDIMSSKLVVIDCDNSVFEIAKTMVDKRVSSVILVDSGKPVGILTERDLAHLVCAKDLVASKTPGTAIMSAPVITVNEGTTLEVAAAEMVKNRLRHLAVEDEQHKVIGFITVTDIAMFLGREILGKELTVLEAIYKFEEPREEIQS
jgi:CBS domain-containing protein